MPTVVMAAIGWLAVITLWAVMAVIVDKHRACNGGWRIPEATLLTGAALGGALGMWVTMRCIRHKTRRRKFMWGLPLLIVLHAALIGAAVYLGT